MPTTLAKAAHSKIGYAIKSGRLVRPTVCEVCDCDMLKLAQLREKYDIDISNKLCAHHWRGYNYPLDIWWICHSCNFKLKGRHDGSLTLSQSRSMIGVFNWQQEEEMLRRWQAYHIDITSFTTKTAEALKHILQMDIKTS